MNQERAKQGRKLREISDDDGAPTKISCKKQKIPDGMNQERRQSESCSSVKVLNGLSVELAEKEITLGGHQPILFRNLCPERSMTNDKTSEYLRSLQEREKALSPSCSPQFRVFTSDTSVLRMGFSELVARSREGKFAYLETSSTDSRNGRGDHFVDFCEDEVLGRCPLQWLPEEDQFKTRCYLCMMQPPHRNVAEWHSDGFHQVILNVFGGDEEGSLKRFQLLPPRPDLSGNMSGWIDAAQIPTEEACSVCLKPGDILYLPAGWIHRVATAGRSFTINWGFYAHDT
eukprot:747115-Hanusia_phi.AAC.5